MGRVIFHIDLNSFFVSAAVLKDPSLKDKPVVVSGNTRRSVVSTASYKAREYGIRSAMPLNEAKKLCPSLIIIDSDFSWYHECSHKFIQCIRLYTDQIEQASIDECYADMSEAIKKEEYPLDLAWKLQRLILDQCGLQCSIGVAPNKFLAKMASDMKKPMGITVLRIQEVSTKLWPLKISEMYGIGKKSSAQCIKLGIKTIGDLANIKDPEIVRNIFGKNTVHVINRANGIDDEPIVTEWQVKSISSSTTMNDDLSDYDEIKQIFFSLCNDIQKRCQKDQLVGNLISITVKCFDFETSVRSKKIEHHTDNASMIMEEVMNLYDEMDNQKPIRLLGVGLSNLKNKKEAIEQINLFTFHEITEDSTDHLLNDFNHKIKKGKLVKASSLLK